MFILQPLGPESRRNRWKNILMYKWLTYLAWYAKKLKAFILFWGRLPLPGLLLFKISKWNILLTNSIRVLLSPTLVLGSPLTKALTTLVNVASVDLLSCTCPNNASTISYLILNWHNLQFLPILQFPTNSLTSHPVLWCITSHPSQHCYLSRAHLLAKPISSNTDLQASSGISFDFKSIKWSQSTPEHFPLQQILAWEAKWLTATSRNMGNKKLAFLTQILASFL